MVKGLLVTAAICGYLVSGGSARADDTDDSINAHLVTPLAQPGAPTVLEQRKFLLKRWAWDQAGPSPNVRVLCGGHPATKVQIKRGAGDIFLAFLTVGMYTPAKATVTCQIPRTGM
jgi:hypothetical protein